ncbi:MAG: SRPBCC family protein [Deltaproteobacteria bacterium]|nr:SRPBCC family protein [Deltaproteobacteria bacterium]
MKLEHQFTVKASVDETWRVLTDLERLAPHMPGAELTGREGEAYKGRVKVKLGPVLAQYEGKASFIEKDDAAKRGVLRAEGRETKGQGNAKATVTAALAETPEGTRVTVETDLAIVGRLAQMGRGLIAEVSGKLLGEFVANLERELAARATPLTGVAATELAPAAADVPAPAPAPREAAPVDLLATAGVPVMKRVLPLAIVAALLVTALLWLL